MSIKIASIDVTRKCTLKCLHCYNYSGDSNCTMHDLSDRDLKEILFDMIALQPDSMCLCGGEPLLRKNVLLKFIREGKKIYPHTFIGMVSNGELLTKETAYELICAGLDSVQISLDGATEEMHDWLRNKQGVFERAIAAIRRLDEARNELNIKFTITVAFCPNKRNFHQLEDAIDLCESLCVDHFRVQPMMLIGRASDNLGDYVLSRNEYQMLIKIINRRYNDNVANGKKMIVEWIDPIDHLLMEQSAFELALQINASGKLLLSPYIPITVGDVRENSIAAYIENDVFRLWSHPFIEYLRNLMITPEKLNLQNQLGLPRVGISEIEFDSLDKECEQKMNEYYKMIRRGLCFQS